MVVSVSSFASPSPTAVARVLSALVVVVVGLCATPAAAGKKMPSTAWVALVHASGDAPAAWAAPLQQAAQAAAGERKWMPPPSTALDELQLALGCAEWDAACASHVAESVGAGNAVVVSLAGGGSGVVVGATVVNADGVVTATAETLALTSTTKDDRHAAERWIASFVRGARPAVLVVTSDLPGDEVLVDGVLVGRTPATIVDVAAGPHALQVRRAGRAPVQRTVTIAAATTVRENAVLGGARPNAGVSPTVGTEAATPSSTTASTAWGLAGIGGLVTVVGGVLAAANGLPVLEASLNQQGGHLSRSYQPLLFGDPVEGEARFAFLAQRFATSAEKVQDPDAFGEIVSRATTLANVGLVLVAAGTALTATGVGLGLTAGEEPATPATTTPAKTTPATTTP